MSIGWIEADVIPFNTSPGARVFLNGLPGNGYINFGKKFGPWQSGFTENGQMYIPATMAKLSVERIIIECGFDMRCRHPATFERLDEE